ncbi:MAG: hypothetical protein ACTSPY_09910 [Candidatus Helarchaeota archaeon]
MIKKNRTYTLVYSLLIITLIIMNINIVNGIISIEDKLIDSNSANWYRISYTAGEVIGINVSSSYNDSFSVGVIISSSVQPYSTIGTTVVLDGEVLNETQNVSIVYVNSNMFQQMMGLYLLIVSLNDSNPNNLSYIINSTHILVPYSYEVYFQDIYLPILLLVSGIIITIAAVVTVFFIRKWYRGKHPKII